MPTRLPHRFIPTCELIQSFTQFRADQIYRRNSTGMVLRLDCRDSVLETDFFNQNFADATNSKLGVGARCAAH
jgi:hypothetical protein